MAAMFIHSVGRRVGRVLMRGEPVLTRPESLQPIGLGWTPKWSAGRWQSGRKAAQIPILMRQVLLVDRTRARHRRVSATPTTHSKVVAGRVRLAPFECPVPECAALLHRT